MEQWRVSAAQTSWWLERLGIAGPTILGPTHPAGPFDGYMVVDRSDAIGPFPTLDAAKVAYLLTISARSKPTT